MTNPLRPFLSELNTVLVVDDDSTIRELTRYMLRRDGFQVIEAANGSEAVTLFSSHAIDLIMIDYQMPFMDGIEAVAAVRALPNGNRVPVIMMTAVDDPNVMEQAFSAGVTDFVNKPFHWSMLRHRIRRLLEYRHAQEQIRNQASELEGLVERRTRQLKETNAKLQQEIAQREQSETKLRQITDTMLDAVYQVNVNGMIEWASPSCWQVLGYPIRELVGQIIYRFVHPDDVENMRREVETIGAAEYRFRRAQSEYIWLETLTNRIIMPNGATTGMVFASRDITERMRAQHELRELNRLKTEFLSTAAHELRTPLTSLRGFSEIMLTRNLPPERQRSYMRIINDQATHLAKLIDDLLDISRLESKRGLTLNRERFDLVALIDEMMTPFLENAGRHVFAFACDEHTVEVTGDRARLSQVVQNLLSNAVKYSPEGGAITASIRRRGQSMIEVSVSDRGIGMTAEQMTHLFEKFYRADASNTTISGTGLGLAISKMLIELHDGSIRVESEYGRGSTFYFSIPTCPLEQMIGDAMPEIVPPAVEEVST